jgi:aminoglycoside phosphotransferase (APT) family kinase protein
MPVLARASSRAPVDGTALQHLDVRSDNLCFREDGSVVLIDWNLACTAAPHVDLVTWLPSLEAEGGPAPEAVVGDGGGFAGEAALVAGFFAARAGLPVIPHAPLVRQVQLAQLRSALPWAARANGLPPPEPPLV